MINMDAVTTIIAIIGPIASAAGAVYLFGRKVGAKSTSIENTLGSLAASVANLERNRAGDHNRAERIEHTLAQLQSGDKSLETALGTMAESQTQIASRVEDLDERVQGQDVRLARLEQALTAIPQIATDIAAVREAQSASRSELAHMAGLMEGKQPRSRTRGK